MSTDLVAMVAGMVIHLCPFLQDGQQYHFIPLEDVYALAERAEPADDTPDKYAITGIVVTVTTQNCPSASIQKSKTAGRD